MKREKIGDMDLYSVSKNKNKNCRARTMWGYIWFVFGKTRSDFAFRPVQWWSV